MNSYGDVSIYALIDPRSDEIRYIGKSVDPDMRYQQHLNESAVNNGKIAWIEELQNEGHKPLLEILELTTENEWAERERWWIKRGLEFGWNLLNIKSGGSGGGFNIPACIHKLLPEDILKRFSGLPNREQADIVIEAALSCADDFMNMSICISKDDDVGRVHYQNEMRKKTINRIGKLC